MGILFDTLKTMNKKTKTEAEKIIQELIPIVDPDFGKLIKKTTLSKVKQCAIIDVKHTIEHIESMYPHPRYGSELDRYQSILTELENK